GFLNLAFPRAGGNGKPRILSFILFRRGLRFALCFRLGVLNNSRRRLRHARFARRWRCHRNCRRCPSFSYERFARNRRHLLCWLYGCWRRSRWRFRNATACRRRDSFDRRRSFFPWFPSHTSRFVDSFKTTHAPIVGAAFGFLGLGCGYFLSICRTLGPPGCRLLVFLFYRIHLFLVPVSRSEEHTSELQS